MTSLFHKSLRSRGAWLLLGALALPIAAGCAGANRETYMREHAGEHVYDRPMPEVWAAAKQLLADDGYSGREVRGGWAYVTEWKEENSGSSISATATRYLLEGKELGPSRCVVKYTIITRSAGASASGLGQADNTHTGQVANINAGNSDSLGTPSTQGTEGIGGKSTIASGKRDLEMEWKLLSKLDPKAAGAIEAQAKREYPDD